MTTIKEILSVLSEYDFSGSDDPGISRIIPFNPENDDPASLMWVSKTNSRKIHSSTQGLILIPSETEIPKNALGRYIKVEDPRRSFQIILEKLFTTSAIHSISSKAIIDAECKLGKNVFIGHHAILEKGCIVGDNSYIGHNTILLTNTVIGKGVKIGCNCTIGGDGFGFTQGEERAYQRMPHLGNVIIQDGVEIGNNTCIDRAVLGSTFIGKNSKIDNQVHIAHGVQIGENTLIIANSMIAGSVLIGDNVWISPNVSILNKMKIGNDAFIGIGSVVVTSLKKNKRVFGNPASEI